MKIAVTETLLLISTCLITLKLTTVYSFNLDTKFPIIYSGPNGSYFGYTVALTFNSKGYIALVGAPRANFTVKSHIFEPGALFCCNITSNICQEVDVTKGLPFMSGFAKKKTVRYRMWLGVTLEVQYQLDQSLRSGNDIVVCAHLHYDYTDYHNGICYVLNRDMTATMQICPLRALQKQFLYDHHNSEYRSYYANGQLGMSALFFENGSRIAIGAPGILEGTGSIVYFHNNRFTDIVKTPSPEIESHSYFGYSITKGNFFNSTFEYHAVGAPRDENHGKVYIISTSWMENTIILLSLKGFELGEYFGASVLGVDFNGDSYTDLAVGAPLYDYETGCDEGKVYIYLSDGHELNYQTELIGDKKSDGRFGTAIGNIGDLNRDGFSDIAVGAPYEDGKGAVYIYHGSDSGVISQYSQKIEAIQISPNLAGFGIHISRGYDIDDNGYLDLLIGSYGSSNAVLLRSRPVIQVYLELHFNPSKIERNKAECIYQGKNLPCFHVDACLNYAGKQVPASLDFQYTIFDQDFGARGSFFPYQYKNTVTQRNVTVKLNIETCLALQFYLRPDIKDVVNPITINFSCKLLPPADLNDDFQKTYPVVSPFSLSNITREIPFHNGCLNDTVCFSDLIVEAKLHGKENNTAITIGEVTSVSLDVTVRNEGEPAYLSQLLIYLPPELAIINKDFCETRNQPQQEVIVCDLGNPLVKGRQVNIQIKLDITKILPHTKFLEIFFEGVTNSSEINHGDNILTFSIEVQTISDIGIRGTPSHYLTLYHESQQVSSIINHKYTVKNYGPSPLQVIDISLQVPTTILSPGGRIPFTYFTGLKVDSESDQAVPAVCNDALLGIENSRTPVKPWEETTGDDGKTIYDNKSFFSPSTVEFLMEHSNTPKNPRENLISSQSNPGKNTIPLGKESENIVISCDTENIECVTLQCSSSPFSDVRKFAQISVAFEVDYTVLKNFFGLWHQIEFITTGSISIPDSDVIHLPHHPEITRVKTVFVQERQQHRDVPQWLYFVGISIGLILLLQIVFILIKVGFFKRKEKEILKRLKQLILTESTEDELSQDSSETATILT